MQSFGYAAEAQQHTIRSDYAKSKMNS